MRVKSDVSFMILRVQKIQICRYSQYTDMQHSHEYQNYHSLFLRTVGPLLRSKTA